MGQKMTRAPLFLVIAQVRYNPILLLSSYVKPIQDAMRKAGYPDYRPGQQITINFQPPGPGASAPPQPTTTTVDRFLFLNQEGTSGFIVDPNSITYQAADYSTSDCFRTQFLAGLSSVHDQVTLSYIVRTGMRYLNAIEPGGETNFQNYLSPGVLGLAETLPDDAAIEVSLSETRAKVSNCNVIAKTLARVGPLALPMDIDAQGIHLDSRFENINGLHAILDIDTFENNRHSYKLETTAELLTKLHSAVRVVFEASVTAQARSHWGERS